MILADKIINERKKNGWSQEELAEMLDVSRQSVSKWEGASSVPDLSKILKMAEIFGVSTDYLLKDEMEPENAQITYEKNSTDSLVRKVSMEEATRFISLRKEILPKIGLGVFLCISSPVIMLFLMSLAQSGKGALSVTAATATGLAILLIQVGIAVFLFISKGSKLSEFDYIEKDVFETEYGVDGMVKEKKTSYESTNTKALSIGVVMIILGVVPVVVSSVLGMGEMASIGSVCLLLLLVATAVYMFVSICGVYSSYNILLQNGDYTKENKKKTKKLEPMITGYWLFIVAVFLAYSFLTSDWGRSWIIWPVAGVLFALLRVIAGSLIRED